MEQEHLGLYWYQDTATVDRRMDSLYATLTEAQTILEFYKTISRMNVDPDIPGRGVIPDYVVPTDCEDYANGRDTQLKFTKKLIKEIG